MVSITPPRIPGPLSALSSRLTDLLLCQRTGMGPFSAVYVIKHIAEFLSFTCAWRCYLPRRRI